MLGVCRKLGEKFGIDPLIFQALFLFGFFFTSFPALLFYLVLHFLLRD